MLLNNDLQKEFDTLPDYLDKNLTILSIGLNPSVGSVEAGFYFANPRNRFWKALNNSSLISEVLEPSVEAIQILFEKYAIGFTDVVKRPTVGAGDLRAADYKQWAPVLRRNILDYQPKLAWFHGKVAYGQYLRYAETDNGNVEKENIEWGKQSGMIGNTSIFVTPNTSPANAVFSLDDLSHWFQQLKCLREKILSENR